MGISIEQARAAKEAARQQLEGVPGVLGIGITKVGADYALQVNLREALPEGAAVPDRIHGVPVQSQVVGPIRKQR